MTTTAKNGVHTQLDIENEIEKKNNKNIDGTWIDINDCYKSNMKKDTTTRNRIAISLGSCCLVFLSSNIRFGQKFN